MGNVVLSLRSGGGDTLTRGLKRGAPKINGGTLSNTYIHRHHAFNFDFDGYMYCKILGLTACPSLKKGQGADQKKAYLTRESCKKAL